MLRLSTCRCPGRRPVLDRRLRALWLAVLGWDLMLRATMRSSVGIAAARRSVSAALAVMLRRLMRRVGLISNRLFVGEALHLMRGQHGGRQGQQQLQPVGISAAEVVPAMRWQQIQLRRRDRATSSLTVLLVGPSHIHSDVMTLTW